MIAGALVRFDGGRPGTLAETLAFALALKAGVFVKLATQAQWTNRRSLMSSAAEPRVRANTGCVGVQLLVAAEGERCKQIMQRQSKPLLVVAQRSSEPASAMPWHSSLPLASLTRTRRFTPGSACFSRQRVRSKRQYSSLPGRTRALRTEVLAPGGQSPGPG